jgi:hypothetical protein
VVRLCWWLNKILEGQKWSGKSQIDFHLTIIQYLHTNRGPSLVLLLLLLPGPLKSGPRAHASYCCCSCCRRPRPAPPMPGMSSGAQSRHLPRRPSCSCSYLRLFSATTSPSRTTSSSSMRPCPWAHASYCCHCRLRCRAPVLAPPRAPPLAPPAPPAHPKIDDR